MPTDELDCAEATLAVLERVLADLGPDDSSKQTPCREFDVSSLTDHLLDSITAIGGAAGGCEVHAREDVSAYVLQMSRGIITQEGRANVGFDDPVELPEHTPALDGLLAFTGRRR